MRHLSSLLAAATIVLSIGTADDRFGHSVAISAAAAIERLRVIPAG